MLGRITILAALAAPLASAQSELPEARFLRVDYTFRDAAIPPSQIRQITAQIAKTSFDARIGGSRSCAFGAWPWDKPTSWSSAGPACSAAQSGTARRGFSCAPNSSGGT
jgi:hypothetical protein